MIPSRRFGGEKFALLTLLLIVCSAHAGALVDGATLSGVVKDTSGRPLAQATVTVKNLASGGTATAQTNTSGEYTLVDLAAGNYEVTASFQGQSQTQSVSLAEGAQQTVNLTVNAGLSLQDLGFSREQTQGNAQEQARLDKRSHMLRIHQKLGLITLVPMAATIITGMNAGGRHNINSTDRTVHAALGSVTAGMYFTTAYFAIAAPRIPGTPTRGPIKLHKILAFIHGPGMVLTPILGAMAYQQRSRGERLHGIASAHGAVAVTTGVAYALAMLSVSLKHF